MPYDYAREYLRRLYQFAECGVTAPNPVQIVCGLIRAGASIPAATAVLRDLVGAEIVPDNPTNGYTRQILGQLITSIDATGNTVTIPEHRRTANQECYLISTGSPPPPLATGTPYYVLNPTVNTMQFALTPGGAAIDITSLGFGSHYLKMGSSFDATDKREESIYDECTFAAVTNDIVHQGYFNVAYSDVGSSVQISSINIISDEITTTALHGRITGDPVLITFDTGGSQPGGTSATTIVFFRVTSATTGTLHTTLADANAGTGLVNITSAGSLVRLRNCRGILVGWDTFASPVTIPAGRSQTFELPTNVSNQRTAVGLP